MAPATAEGDTGAGKRGSLSGLDETGSLVMTSGRKILHPPNTGKTGPAAYGMGEGAIGPYEKKKK